jgi:hypothetical protein
MAMLVHGQRDQIVTFPSRVAAIMAADVGADEGQLFMALTVILRAFCAAAAGAVAPEGPLQLPEEPPPAPAVQTGGFYPSYVDNEHARRWREKHPADAAAQAAWEAEILDYYDRHGITPGQGQAGYGPWCHKHGK